LESLLKNLLEKRRKNNISFLTTTDPETQRQENIRSSS